jgi:hypothetical protein
MFADDLLPPTTEPTLAATGPDGGRCLWEVLNARQLPEVTAFYKR